MIAPTDAAAAILVPHGVTLRLGRAPGNDVVLDDPSVDDVHVEVVARPDGLRVQDLSHTGCVRVNGQIVVGALLADGDELIVGALGWRWTEGVLAPITIDDLPLRAEAVAVVAGATTLLAPTDLAVADGEFLAVIGPSGAGKSTLLKVLAGLRQPSRGRVLVRGNPATVRQSDLGFVAQDDAVHPLLTARETLTYAARLRLREDATDEACEAAVAAALAEVDLLEAADRRIARLSGGQRKRVALAQELLADPAVLLLDEPTSGLDPALERRMMELMRRLATGGRSVVVVTHHVGHLSLCDRVAVMAPGGRMAALAAPAEVLAHLGVDSFDEVFAHLPAALPDDPITEPDGAERRVREAGRLQARRRRIRPQVFTLTRRYARVVARDRRNLRLLAVQALALSAGAGLLFGRDVFASTEGGFLHAGESAQLLFLMVTMAIWFGAIASARQIVAERAVLARELAIGVRTEAYLLSKVLVLGAIAALQTVVMVAIVLLLRPLHAHPGTGQAVTMLLIACSWAGVAFGLVVSAFARSEDQATSYIPLVLLPQLLLGGAIVPTAQLSTLMAWLSNLAAARWGFAAVGHAVSMNGRIAGDAQFAQASRYGSDFFSLGAFGALCALGLLSLACAVVLQARLRPSFEDTWWQQLRFRVRTREPVRRADLAFQPLDFR